jgi:hypothetical protein
VRTLTTAIVATLALALPGLPVHAAEQQVTCVINEVIRWEPPLKNIEQQVTFHTTGQLTGCTGGLSATATYSETGTYASATCTTVLRGGTGIRVWDWTADGVESSHFAYIVTGGRVNGNIVAVATGPIIAGAYKDSAVRSAATAPEPDPLACAGDGVARVLVAGTLTIGV